MANEIPSFKKINSQKHKKNTLFHKTHSKLKTPESVTSNVSTPPVSRLPSNWDKYEKTIDDQLESTSFVGLDFSTLSLLPTNNSQFLLKQDKAFLPNSESNLNAGDFFELNMNLISLGLATIPLYQRIGMDKEDLTVDELSYMDKTALEANSRYHTYLSKNTVFARIDDDDINESDFSNTDEVEIRTDNLDGGETSGEEKNIEIAQLEEWLDNVL